jgi:hypothetical protein
MLYKEKIAVCSEINTGIEDSLRLQEVEYLFVKPAVHKTIIKLEKIIKISVNFIPLFSLQFISLLTCSLAKKLLF